MEYCIGEVDGVVDVAVLCLDNVLPARLVGVVQSAPGQSDNDALAQRILAHCRTWLPRAAVPVELIFVAAMPMGPTGKKSHTTLRAMLTGRRPDNPVSERPARAAPAPGSVEARLAEMWRDLLQGNGSPVAAINLEDDVFTLGASSLDALPMVERIERAFEIRFPDHQMFVRRTVASQASLVKAASKPASDTTALAVTSDALELHMVRAGARTGSVARRGAGDAVDRRRQPLSWPDRS